MGRTNNYHDNVVVESFLVNLKKKTRRKKTKTRADTRHAMFHNIQIHYNVNRRHRHDNRVQLTVYEQRYLTNQESD